MLTRSKWLCGAVLMLLQILLPVPAIATTTWQQTNGPVGGGISHVVTAPNDSQVVYAWTYGEIFRSSNGGNSWSAAYRGINPYILCFAIDPTNSQTLYIGTYGGGVYKSIDGGASWAAMNSGFTANQVQSVVVDPLNSQIVYAATMGGGVFKSVNGGGSWNPVNDGLPIKQIYYMTMDPLNNKVLYASISSTDTENLYKSTDGGISWKPISSGLYKLIKILAFNPSNTQIIYALTSNSALIKSTDGGVSWNSVTSYPLTMVFDLNINPGVDQSILTIGYSSETGRKVYKSSDGGATWQAINTPNDTYSISVNPTNNQTIYVATSAGVLKSSDGGGSWNISNNGFVNSTVKAFAIDSSQAIYAGTSVGLFKSTDGGISWNSINSGITNSQINSIIADPANDQILYVGTDDGLFKSNNNGSTWNAISTGIATKQITSIAIDRTDTQIIYAGTNGGVYKSLNSGLSWTAVNTGFTSLKISCLVIDPSNTKTIYAGTNEQYYGTNRGIFKSTNGGLSWSECNNGIGNLQIQSLAIDPTNSQTIYTGTAFNAFKSTDGGASWKVITSSIVQSSVSFIAIDPANSSRIYIACPSVYVSKDAGTSWSGINNGLDLPNSTLNTLVFNPINSQMIYIGTSGYGVFKGLYPTISGNPATMISAGIAYSFTPASNNANSFSIINKPTWGSFNPNTGALTGTPSNTDIGTYDNIVISAVNSTATASLAAFSIEVKRLNTPPVANTGGPYLTSFAQSLTFNAGASSDPDSTYGDSIASYEWDLNNDGTFETTGTAVTVSWTQLSDFGINSVGTFTIRLKVTDSFGASSAGTTTITVTKGTPTISTQPTASGITIGQRLSSSTLSGGAASVPGTFAFATPSYKPATVGTFTADYIFTPNDSANYNTVSGPVAVAVAALINGSCGTANNGFLAAAPSVASELCSQGTPSTVVGSGPWGWQCDSTNGGGSASCTANQLNPPIVTTSTQPIIDFAGTAAVKAGSSFDIFRSEGGKAYTQIASGVTGTSYTDLTSLKPNTIYQYAVASDSDANRTVFTTIRTPLFSGWNIVAVPYDITGTPLNSLFDSQVGKIIEWRPSGATAENSSSQLGAFVAVNGMVPGKGYFVKVGNGSTLLNYTGTPGPASVTVTLKPGWTMVANPQANNLGSIASNWLVDGDPLGTAIVSGKIGGGIYWWNGIAYDSWSIVGDNPEVEPWKGYWILNLDSRDHALTIK